MKMRYTYLGKNTRAEIQKFMQAIIAQLVANDINRRF